MHRPRIARQADPSPPGQGACRAGDQRQLQGHLQHRPHAPSARAQTGIHALRRHHPPRIGPGPHGLVLHRHAVAGDRRGIGTDPVVIAVLAAILHHAHPRATAFEGLPHMGKGRRRHVRMAQQIMWRAQQLLAAVAADVDKVLVGVGNRTAEVGGRENVGILGNVHISTRDREIDLHGKRARGLLGESAGAPTLSAPVEQILIQLMFHAFSCPAPAPAARGTPQSGRHSPAPPVRCAATCARPVRCGRVSGYGRSSPGTPH